METMTPHWKSTINNVQITPDLLHPLLKEILPQVIKKDIQELANLILFQNNIKEPNSSQVPVDMKFTDSSLDVRTSENAPWISLLPSTKLTMSPQEKAVDEVRKNVMEKIGLLCRGVSNGDSSESHSEIKNPSPSFSSRKNSKIAPGIRSKRSRRQERDGRIYRNREPSSIISRNKIDCSTNTTNNYYCCVGSHGKLFNSTEVNTLPHTKNVTTQMTQVPLSTHERSIQTDSPQTVPLHEKETSTDFKQFLMNASTDIDLDITTPKTTQMTQVPLSTHEQSIQTDSKLVSREQSTNTEDAIDATAQSIDMPSREGKYSSLESLSDLQGFFSTEDITKLHTFIYDSLKETDAFIDLLKTSETEIDPKRISLLIENRDLLISLQDLLYSDPQLAINSDKVNSLLDKLDLDTLKLIHNTSNLEIPYLDQEDYSDNQSTLVGSEETLFESESLDAGYIDDEIVDQLNVGITNINSFDNPYEDEWDNLLPSNLFEEQILSNNTVPTQTDPYMTANELQLQEKLRKLELTLEKTKSIHKDELASLLRAQDRLQAEANTRIKEALESSIETERAAFSRAQDSHKRYNKLLENNSKEISSLKEFIEKLESINQAKKTEFDSFRSTVYSPPSPQVFPKIARTEMQDQSVQVENLNVPTINVEAKGAIFIKTKPKKEAKASPSKFKEYDRRLAAMNINALRAEKAELELHIRKNGHLPKAKLAEKKELLQWINNELIRRNQRPQPKQSDKNNQVSKKSLNQMERNRKDLGKTMVQKYQDKLNRIRTNNK